jgi:hypothetical protein
VQQKRVPLAHHYVNVGPDGTFAGSGTVQTLPGDIDEMFKKLGDVDKIVLHFHGGLVSEAAGVEIAERLIPVYTRAGAHGIAVIWETGLVETIGRNLDTINKTKLFNKLVGYAIRHAARWLGADVGGRGVAGGHLSLAEVAAARAVDAEIELVNEGARSGLAVRVAEDLPAIEAELQAEVEADIAGDSEIDSLVVEEAPATPLLDQRILGELEDQQARGIFSTVAVARLVVRVTTRTLRRFAERRDHGIIPTVVEEVLREAYVADLGAWTWSGMKTSAEAMWSPNDGPLGEKSHAGSYLLAKLAELQANRPGVSVDLVGHSAGSIAICKLLETSAQRHTGFRVRNIVFLAPACTPEVFEQGVLRHRDRFEAFRMFTMHDELEQKDRLVPGVYPRSLLYFISGVLEGDADTPILGLERHTTGASPYASELLTSTHDYLNLAEQNHVVLSRTEAELEGLMSTAARHGDFDNDELTLESLAAIVAR